MGKMKTRKSILKRIKITSKGKLLRRHQLGVGHLKRKKTKGALERHKKTFVFFKGEARKLRKVIGIQDKRIRVTSDKSKTKRLITLILVPRY